jgi:SAM-dependent methyltransferase
VTDHGIIDLYERHAGAFDRARGRDLQEQAWLDRFLSLVPPGGEILDIGCGAGEPVAAYVLRSGRGVTGIDSSPSMIAICRGRFPAAEWHAADMRSLSLERQFDGIVAWDSVFHLDAAAQRAMFPIFAAHSRAGAALLFTSGPGAGEAVGDLFGERLYHASLDEMEYRALLEQNGFTVAAHVKEDRSCGMHTIWLATFNTVT